MVKGVCDWAVAVERLLLGFRNVIISLVLSTRSQLRTQERFISVQHPQLKNVSWSMLSNIWTAHDWLCQYNKFKVQSVPKRLFRAICRWLPTIAVTAGRERQRGEFYNPILLTEVSCLRGSWKHTLALLACSMLSVHREMFNSMHWLHSKHSKHTHHSRLEVLKGLATAIFPSDIPCFVLDAFVLTWASTGFKHCHRLGPHLDRNRFWGQTALVGRSSVMEFPWICHVPTLQWGCCCGALYIPLVKDGSWMILTSLESWACYI